MVSLKDISKACGVSVATVSKALNDHSDISQETKFLLLITWQVFLLVAGHLQPVL